ncbi:nuclear pore complex protein NUP1 isoform X1 [Amborella trichopoda]|uniref:Nuclear pore complex protein NUP1 n=1 Tax=Amborella trichopoda TaxID=13333 RepID=W1NEY0_AMBTC|nr:nuclear pore complex protein NUP1 isoform X1 [Amborella trichopoda]ERM93665.1 hypothetical protein AMTR_s00004p00164270 [Amborella trichopoda]|eukprot:XP_006826428.1 nuclear pore complex protein NUP1 isoform X1 [Amborella trichopoda]
MVTGAGAYEGGAGGKIRRKPPRKPSTPYDRPLSLSGLRNPSDEGRNGWLSKLVDPASKIIANGAAKLFSSVFRKRLGPPPANSDVRPEARNEPIKDGLDNPLLVEPEQVTDQREKQDDALDSTGFNELEELLKQKTFTREEFDRLSELLRSRTVDSSSDESKRVGLNTLEATVNPERQSNLEIVVEEGTNPWQSSNPGNVVTPAVHSSILSQIPDDVGASPAEIARAYMGVRPSRASPSSFGLRSHPLRRDVSMIRSTTYAPKSVDLSLTSKSSVRFSGFPGLAEDGYLTPTRGRSTLYNAIRTPYSRPVGLTDQEGSANGYAGPSTPSYWTTANGSSGGRQVLKRRSSVMENGFGSVGTIRRIRQKSNLMVLSKAPNASVPASSPLPLLLPGSDADQNSFVPPKLDVPESSTSKSQADGNGEERGVVMVPQQTRETVKRIFAGLDKMFPSPKDKSSELRLATGAPTKLTPDMLQGQAKRSMEIVDFPKLPNLHGNCLDAHNGTQSHGPTVDKRKEMGVANGPLKIVEGRREGTESPDTRNSNVAATNAISGVVSVDTASQAISTAKPSRKRQGFQMSAPEVSLDPDEGIYGGGQMPSPKKQGPPGSETFALQMPSGSKKEASLREPFTLPKPHGSVQNASTSEAVPTPKPLVPSAPVEKPALSSTQLASLDTKATSGPIVSQNNLGFTFPVTPSSLYSEAPPTPTTSPFSMLDKPVQPKEKASSQFGFGSTSTAKVPAFSIPSSPAISDSSSLKFGAGTSVLDGSSFKFGAGAVSSVSLGSNMKFGEKTTPSIPDGPTLKFGGRTSPLMSDATNLKFGAGTVPSVSDGTTEKFGAGTGTTALDGSTPKFGVVTVSAVSDGSNVQFGGVSGSGLKFGTGLERNGQTSGSNAAVATSSVSPPVNTGSVEPNQTTQALGEPLKPSENAPTTSGTKPEQSPTPLNSLFSNSSPTPIDQTSSVPSFSTFSSSFPSPSFQFGSSSTISSTSTTMASLQPTTTESKPSPLSGATGASFLAATNSSFGLFGQSAPNSGVFGLTNSAAISQTSPQSGSTAVPLSSSSPFQFGSASSQFGSSGSLFGSSSPSTAGNLSASGSGGATATSIGTGSAPPPFNFGFNASSSSSGVAAFSSSSSSPAFQSFGSSTAPLFGSGFGTSASTGFSFGGSSASMSSHFSGASSAPTSTPFTFVSTPSSGPVFPFTSSAATQSPNPFLGQGFGASASPMNNSGNNSNNNDQMNVEDSMAEDTVQTMQPSQAMISAFGSPSPSSSFVFGAPSATPTGGPAPFQFAATPSPIGAGGSLEYAGGSFSVGAGGDKSVRKIIRARRDKVRKK